MATISAWKGERSRVGGALWHLAFKREVLGLCPLGSPLVYVHTAGGEHRVPSLAHPTPLGHHRAELPVLYSSFPQLSILCVVV